MTGIIIIGKKSYLDQILSVVLILCATLFCGVINAQPQGVFYLNESLPGSIKKFYPNNIGYTANFISYGIDYLACDLTFTELEELETDLHERWDPFSPYIIVNLSDTRVKIIVKNNGEVDITRPELNFSKNGPNSILKQYDEEFELWQKKFERILSSNEEIVKSIFQTKDYWITESDITKYDSQNDTVFFNYVKNHNNFSCVLFENYMEILLQDKKNGISLNSLIQVSFLDDSTYIQELETSGPTLIDYNLEAKTFKKKIDGIYYPIKYLSNRKNLSNGEKSSKKAIYVSNYFISRKGD